MGAMDLQHFQYRDLGKCLQVWAGENVWRQAVIFAIWYLRKEWSRIEDGATLPSSGQALRWPLQKLVQQRHKGFERLLRGARKAKNIKGEWTEIETQGPAPPCR